MDFGSAQLDPFARFQNTIREAEGRGALRLRDTRPLDTKDHFDSSFCNICTRVCLHVHAFCVRCCAHSLS